MNPSKTVNLTLKLRKCCTFCHFKRFYYRFCLSSNSRWKNGRKTLKPLRCWFISCSTGCCQLCHSCTKFRFKSTTSYKFKPSSPQNGQNLIKMPQQDKTTVANKCKHAANKKTDAKRKRCISSHTTQVLQASRGQCWASTRETDNGRAWEVESYKYSRTFTNNFNFCICSMFALVSHRTKLTSLKKNWDWTYI